VISEIVEENLVENVNTRAEQIRREIASWDSIAIDEVRGAGLLIGIGLNVEALSLGEGDTASIKACKVLQDLGLLVPPAGTDTIRLLPPLNVSEAEVTEALGILKQGLDSML